MSSNTAIYVGAGEMLEHDTCEREKIISNFNPLGRRLLGIKCFVDHTRDENGNVLLYMTDEFMDNTNWFQIVKAGPECKYINDELLEKYNVFMMFPVWEHGMHGLGYNLFLVDESLSEKKNPTLQPYVMLEEKSNAQ